MFCAGIEARHLARLKAHNIGSQLERHPGWRVLGMWAAGPVSEAMACSRTSETPPEGTARVVRAAGTMDSTRAEATGRVLQPGGPVE